MYSVLFFFHWILWLTYEMCDVVICGLLRYLNNIQVKYHLLTQLRQKKRKNRNIVPQCYKDTIGLGQTGFLNCKVVRTSNESWPTTARDLPEDADANPLSNLGEEVEMKTFKTNVPPTLECDKDQALIIKIICLGGYMFGVGRKGGFIKDYLQVTQLARIGYYPPLFWIGCDFHVKTIKCKKRRRPQSFNYHQTTILGDGWRWAYII